MGCCAITIYRHGLKENSMKWWLDQDYCIRHSVDQLICYGVGPTSYYSRFTKRIKKEQMVGNILYTYDVI